jgi:hypothetical protein
MTKFVESIIEQAAIDWLKDVSTMMYRKKPAHYFC